MTEHTATLFARVPVLFLLRRRPFASAFGRALPRLGRALARSRLVARTIVDRAYKCPELPARVHAVRQRGLQVSIDDFGTGYSSLGYLSRLPIDALKIDRSFVVRMFEGAEDMAIVTTIISLAHALDLKVIAEGVETAQQADQLRLLRCDQLQGFLAARPQPAEEVESCFGRTLLSVTRRGSEQSR